MQDYTLNADIAENIFHSPVDAHENEPYDVTLATIPQKVYKENDGIWEEAATESWTFYVVLKKNSAVQSKWLLAKIEFYSEDEN